MSVRQRPTFAHLNLHGAWFLDNDLVCELVVKHADWNRAEPAVRVRKLNATIRKQGRRKLRGTTGDFIASFHQLTHRALGVYCVPFGDHSTIGEHYCRVN